MVIQRIFKKLASGQAKQTKTEVNNIFYVSRKVLITKFKQIKLILHFSNLKFRIIGLINRINQKLLKTYFGGYIVKNYFVTMT